MLDDASDSLRGRAATDEPVGIQGVTALAASDAGGGVRDVAGARPRTDAYARGADADNGAVAAT
jgi:hypothetical protein